jgi:disulfide bond formation protein DsbB
MFETIWRDLHQPEYVHTLLNPLPVYGLALGLLGLIIALFLRSRTAQIATLAIIFVGAIAAWPAAEFGEQGYDVQYARADREGDAWLEAHKQRAQRLLPCFYALAALAAAAIAAPMKWPRSALPLTIATLILAVISLGAGGYIAYAGGKVQHREFRHAPPPVTPKNS